MIIKTIITAGGTSSRYGSKNKLLEMLCGKEVIKHTVEKFSDIPEITEIIICANESIIEPLENFFSSYGKVKIIKGGNTRTDSVYNGLCEAGNCDYILIHDGARPLVSKEIILNTITSVKEKNAVSVMTKTTDTIKLVDDDMKIVKTIDRTHLYNTQTPQAFKYDLIKNAHEKFRHQNFTDDASMAEALGHNVYIVEGDYKNIKITTKNDIIIAQTYMKDM